ncbi:calcitonin gene-related peptide type 1 receptor isoform X5 [Octopus sinensis]|uniref:Calcitonin gene-related peptide type 1 receptor isoform X5 n=1 Tax=Octopus sinensis TaxID=2607531 RepID=A0A7E6EI07_9MOLL|nr:calcitonin gene-related peptide type 1 receptor isoform X5 [Octopus sinensis]
MWTYENVFCLFSCRQSNRTDEHPAYKSRMNTTTNAANRSLLKQHYSGNLSNFSGINSLPDQCNSTALSTDHLTGGNFCESTFDGYLCWNPTKAGERVSQPCPLNHAGLAFKDCLPNATWFRHPVTNLPWTDFTSCFINHVWCQAVHVITQYTTCSNYFWMFCEGFFMHTLIMNAFSTSCPLLYICHIIGWGIPAVPTIIYSVLRALYGDSKRCWTGSSRLQWIILGPIILSLLVSLALGANILRMLLSKLRARNTDPYHQTSISLFSRGVRATLLLIPLLGLHYFILPLKPEGNEKMEFVYDIISALLISLQGFFVSLLFCFLNEEVISVIKRKFQQIQIQFGHIDVRRPSNALTLVESTSFSTKGINNSVPGSPKQNRTVERQAMLLHTDAELGQ